MTRRRKILIAGAGLGGLSAAANLLQAGHQVEVFEQAPELGEVGAGIQVSANATKVLFNLGLREALERIAVRPERSEFRLFDSGEVVSVIPLGTAHEDRFGAPYFHLYRPDFLKVLADRVRAMRPDAIHLAAAATSYEEAEEGIVLHLGNGRHVAGDLLIGADGIKSSVRAQMHGAEPPNFTGQVAYRGFLPAERLPVNFMPHIFVNWMGPRRHMVVYWVSGGRFLNFVGCTERKDWTGEGWTVKAPWEDLKAVYEGFHPDVHTLLDLMDRDQVYGWALNIRPRLPYWSTQRTTLLGDACHPTLPYMAQGAVMSIEDAAVLTRALDEVEDLPMALRIYEASRMERTYRIVEESNAHARLYHADSHDAFRRAFADKNPAADRARWLYNYDPLSVELIQPDGVQARRASRPADDRGNADGI